MERHPEGRDSWWELDEGDPDVASALPDYVARLVREDTGRLMLTHAWLDLYEGRINSFPDTSYGALYAAEQMGGDRGMLNATQSAIDTLHSKATAEIPTVRAKGVGSDGSQHLRAMRLTRFMVGALEGLKYGDSVGPAMALSALKTGTGCVKTVCVDGRIELENVPVTELFVDRGEARYGRPPRFYQLKAVDRSVALRLWATDDIDAEDAIRAADAPIDWVARRLPIGHDYDLIDVYEAWDLDSQRHVIAIQGYVILDEEWEHADPPLTFLYFIPPEAGRGFWGQGLVERLDPLQYEIDDLLRDIGTAIRMGSRYKIFANSRDAQLNEDALMDPGFGSIVYGTEKPEFLSPDPVNQVVIQHLQWLLQELYSQAGMTEQAASNQAPAGMQSGVALLHRETIVTKRWVDFVKRIAEATCQVALSLVDRAADLEDDGRWTARYSKGSVVRELRWSDVRMRRDEFVIAIQDVSAVPDSFAGREQLIDQMQANGTLPQGYLARMIEDPDVVRANIIASADADLAEAAVEMLLDPTDGDPPLDDNMNVALVTDVVRAALCSGIANGLDSGTLDRMRDYLHALKDLQDALTPPPTPQAAPQLPVMPGGGLPPVAPAPQAPTLGTV